MSSLTRHAHFPDSSVGKESACNAENPGVQHDWVTFTFNKAGRAIHEILESDFMAFFSIYFRLQKFHGNCQKC